MDRCTGEEIIDADRLPAEKLYDTSIKLCNEELMHYDFALCHINGITNSKMQTAGKIGDAGDFLKFDFDAFMAEYDFQAIEDVIDGEEYINYGCWHPL